MKPELFRETCKIIYNEHSLLHSTGEKFNAIEHLNNLINEFDKIIATNGIIESDVYNEIVLFTRVYDKVCDIQKWMIECRDLKIKTNTDLNRFPAKTARIHDALEIVQAYENRIQRTLQELAVIICNSYIFQDVYTK